MKWKNLGTETCVFFINGTITEWRPLFMRPEVRDILLKDLEFYRSKYNARILAYVIMPEHYHILLELNRPEDLTGWLRDVQGYTANEISKWLRRTVAPEELAIYAAHANGGSKLAVWKEQARATGMKTEEKLRIKFEYIHSNPVKRKLVTEPGQWFWSSWRNYYLDDDSVFRVDRVELL